MPLGRIVHSYDDNEAGLWNANFEEGLRIAKATDAKEVWQGRAVQPTIHLMGGTIMGTGPENSVWTRSAGPTRCRTSGAPVGHLPHRGRLQSDLYSLGPVAARRRAPRRALEHDRG